MGDEVRVSEGYWESVRTSPGRSPGNVGMDESRAESRKRGRRRVQDGVPETWTWTSPGRNPGNVDVDVDDPRTIPGRSPGNVDVKNPGLYEKGSRTEPRSLSQWRSLSCRGRRKDFAGAGRGEKE